MKIWVLNLQLQVHYSFYCSFFMSSITSFIVRFEFNARRISEGKSIVIDCVFIVLIFIKYTIKKNDKLFCRLGPAIFNRGANILPSKQSILRYQPNI